MEAKGKDRVDSRSTEVLVSLESLKYWRHSHRENQRWLFPRGWGCGHRCHMDWLAGALQVVQRRLPPMWAPNQAPTSPSCVSICGFSDLVAWENSLVLTERGKIGIAMELCSPQTARPFSFSGHWNNFRVVIDFDSWCWGGNPGLCTQGLHASESRRPHPALAVSLLLAWPCGSPSLQSRPLECALPQPVPS